MKRSPNGIIVNTLCSVDFVELITHEHVILKIFDGFFLS